jgi:hypothetical protein
MSRLPEDPGYWDRLADLLVSKAASQLRAHRDDTGGRWRALARLSTPFAIAAAAALIIALLGLPRPAHVSIQDSTAARVYGLAPADQWATLFVTSATAPTIAMLLSTPTLERIP